jgi:hypothetical protein
LIKVLHNSNFFKLSNVCSKVYPSILKNNIKDALPEEFHITISEISFFIPERAPNVLYMLFP